MDSAAKREELLTRLLKAGLYEVDLATGEVARAGAFEALTGFGHAELEPTQSAWFSHLHEGDRAPLAEALRVATERGESFELEYRLLHRDGHLVRLLDRGVVERDGAGRPTRIVGCILGLSSPGHPEESISRALIDAIPDPVFLKDRDGRWLFANPAALTAIGSSAEQVLGKTDVEIFGDTPESQALTKTDRRILESGAGEVVEEEVQTPTGHRLFLATKVALRDSQGHVVGLLGNARDITERKRIEDALRESERRLATIFQVVLTGIIINRLSDGAILDCNEACLRQIGRSREEVLGRTTAELGLYVRPADRQRVYDELRATGKLRPLETLLRRSSGEVGHFLLTAGTVEIGGERCVIGSWHDLTELRQADAALRESEARFRALIEKSTDMVFLIDAEGRHQFWSPSATATLGHNAEEMLGLPAFAHVHPNDLPRLVEALSRVRADPSMVLRLEIRVRHRDGSWRLLEGVGRNLLEDPNVRALVINARDVTEQQRLEEQFRQAQKLESVGRLAGGVAHDFNNLLTVIMGCAESLRHDQQAGAMANPEDIEPILAAGERARDLTQQLLAFARKQVIAPVPLDLNVAVRASEKILQRVLGEDVELVVDLQAGLGTTLCDPSQVEQVLMNLAVNARDAMPRGGTLTLQTRDGCVEGTLAAPCADRRAGEWVRLSVRDTGTGMSPEVQAHLFEPFFTTKEQGKGTGLGLATVHGIVAQSGGHIHVLSEPGQGPTFDVCFPRSRAATSSAAPARPTEPGLGSETILVVEDDAALRSLTVRGLQRAGYHVLVASNGRDALELARQEPARLDLVVTDVVMPGLSGREIVDELQRQRPAIRVLYVSGYSRDFISQRGVLDSGTHFLPKPFTMNGLLARVREVLDARLPDHLSR
ncbi:MAG: PAS domain S-box protein [Deltaproteobacteria bacterium]|nr:PAS domain S-box protein [Deltaproteobacteria bacterium]